MTYFETRDKRGYETAPDGSIRRTSIVKLNKKARQKLKAKMREAAMQSGAPVMPIADPEPQEEPKWRDSPERERLMKELGKDL